MKKLSFLFVFLVIFSCKKKEGTYIGGYYWIYGYGYPRMGFYEAAEGISEKWKIKHHLVAGCRVDDKLVKQVDAKNKETYAAIEREYGIGWKSKYNKDLEDFIMREVDIMDVLITNKLFREELKKYYINIDDVDRKIKMLNDSLYQVVVYNQKLKAENKECFSVDVNIKKRTVNLIK
ncbi:hypothetical protein [Chryseobacterium oryctis]|uniref:Lipoprotein n=1 Tax=Chryseobacterium oryctis TaxID=2952618 RepID=A0ABT3HQ44_9FLAO|nr:hypothetical protein [Chryseobacterium oryctis]MCW3161815.1 hypothetical protein [Chryseobacterium oryctis]